MRLAAKAARTASSFTTAFFLKAFLRGRPPPVPGSIFGVSRREELPPVPGSLMTTLRDAGSSLTRANGVEERAASEEEDDEKAILLGEIGRAHV